MLPPSAVQARRRSLMLDYCIVGLGCLAFVVLGFHRERVIFHSRDFKLTYASARCLLYHCNPYDNVQSRAIYLAAKGRDNDPFVFLPYTALYPPSALLIMAPFAVPSYPVAHMLWLITCAIFYCIAGLLIGDLCRPDRSKLALLELAFFIGGSSVLLMLAQASGPAISLAVIALWALIRNRLLWLAPLCFALSLSLKPHVGDLIFLYLLFAGRRWRWSFLWTALICCVLMGAGILWCSLNPATAHWLHDLRANLAAMALPGGLSDPRFQSPQADAIASLQTLTSAVSSRADFYVPAAYLITAILLLGWLIATLRMKSTTARHLLAIAALACITLQPIYHREYDTRLLILIFPALALLLRQRRAWGIVGLLLACFAIFPARSRYPPPAHIPQFHGLVESFTRLFLLVRFRPMQVTNFALAIFFVAAYLAFSRHAAEPAPTDEEIKALEQPYEPHHVLGHS
jgi:hypothetical protein